MSDVKDMIDRNKLTERELLILVSEKVEGMSCQLNKLTDDYVQLHVRIVKLETRNKIVSAIWGIGSILFTIIINLLNYLKHV
jgi:hypothetical protein